MSSKRKFIAAMSGGVDSSVAAALWKERGFELTGVTLRLNPFLEETSEDEGHAAEIASFLGFRHIVLDLKDEFREKVLLKAWREYSSGRTPNPCALCNPAIKFGKLMDYARSAGAEGMITGHYVHKKVLDSGEQALFRSADPSKDQTYFLFALSQEQLKRSCFPLDGMTKTQVRSHASKLGLHVAEKPESQDMCLALKGENFPELLKKLFDGKTEKGFFVSPDGTKLGEHKGIYKYTIGQRKGLGIALGAPAFVSDIDPASGNVTVTTDESELFTDSMIIENPNWQISGFEDTEFECDVQIRYRSAPVPAKIVPSGKELLKAVFREPRRAVTPGQAAVFYKNGMLIGGGWIKKK